MKRLKLAAYSALLASCCLCRAQGATTTASSEAVSNSPKSSTAAHGNSDSYIIGPADILAISVWKEASISGNVLVRPDGMISMTLVGDIRAAGLTPLQLSVQITDRLQKFVKSPAVSVVVAEIHSKNVNLLGEVTKEGPVALTSGMTLLYAIGAAGGLTEFANERKIYILREQNGNRIRIPAHYKQALKGGPNADLVLQPGDTIVVP